MKINEEKLARAEAVHYDFCTRKYRGNAVFYENNLVSVYLRENGARTGRLKMYNKIDPTSVGK